VVNFAREESLRVAPQGTGHGASAVASLEHTILLSTKHMRGVRIDPNTRRARVRAGALWADVTAPASASVSRRWRAPRTTSASSATRSADASAGSAASTAFACDGVTAIELVAADGRLVKTDAHNDPELFRALCGGGGTSAA